jgi:antitoxin component of MazEF toxin-antitoxin module
MYPPHGPHRIGQNRQVALPAELMKLVHLHIGDEVYLQVNDDPPGTLLIVPMEIATDWFERGRRAVGAITDDGAPDTTGQEDHLVHGDDAAGKDAKSG